MAIYRVPYEITGYVVINADSAEEAEAAFARDYSIRELADIGTLEAFPAEGDCEVEYVSRGIEADRNNEINDALMREYMNHLERRQDMAEEQRHG